MRQISQQLGVDERVAGNAVSAALPVLLGALAWNSAQPEGAEALFSALSRDHDGSILDDVTGFLGSGNSRVGDGILRHVLGGRRDPIAAGLGQALGLDPSTANNLLTILAPLVMGALGRMQRQQELDAGGLSSMLGNERQWMEQADPSGLGALSQLLDANQDGQILDDVVRMGAGLLGRLFSGR